MFKAERRASLAANFLGMGGPASGQVALSVQLHGTRLRASRSRCMPWTCRTNVRRAPRGIRMAQLNVRDEIEAGRNVRPRPLAREAGVPPSTIYSQIAKGEIEAIR